MDGKLELLDKYRRKNQTMHTDMPEAYSLCAIDQIESVTTSAA